VKRVPLTPISNVERSMPASSPSRLDGAYVALASLRAEEARLERLGLVDYWEFLAALFTLTPAGKVAKEW
jgi:hypothetical protein